MLAGIECWCRWSVGEGRAEIGSVGEDRVSMRIDSVGAEIYPDANVVHRAKVSPNTLAHKWATSLK